MSKLAVALLFIGLNLYTYRFFAREDVVPPRQSLVSFPLSVDGWSCQETIEMDDASLEVLGVTDYLLCNYVKPDSHEFINFYAGYHARQVQQAGAHATVIHPPEHCMPGSGWDIIDSRIVPIDFGTPGEAKRVIIAKGNQRSLVYFWYQSRGRVIARSHEKILYMFLDRALQGRSDGSLVRVTIPIKHGNTDKADATFRSVAQSLAPLLPKYIPN